jgi:hypothetical protein
MGLASRGLRELGDELEEVTDPEERAAIQRQVKRILRRAGLIAAISGIGAILLP